MAEEATAKDYSVASLLSTASEAFAAVGRQQVKSLLPLHSLGARNVTTTEQMTGEVAVVEPTTKPVKRAQSWTEATIAAGAPEIRPNSPATPTATGHSTSFALGSTDHRSPEAFAADPWG